MISNLQSYYIYIMKLKNPMKTKEDLIPQKSRPYLSKTPKILGVATRVNKFNSATP